MGPESQGVPRGSMSRSCGAQGSFRSVTSIRLPKVSLHPHYEPAGKVSRLFAGHKRIRGVTSTLRATETMSLYITSLLLSGQIIGQSSYILEDDVSG